jgi:hypothetical protein
MTGSSSFKVNLNGNPSTFRKEVNSQETKTRYITNKQSRFPPQSPYNGHLKTRLKIKHHKKGARGELPKIQILHEKGTL